MINLILADDHSVVRQAISELLSSRGNYKVLAEADDGEELLKLLKDFHADLVIMDVQMPGLDGLAALHRMAHDLGKVPPVLILSADDQEHSVRAALKAGARGYLPKNADIAELEFAIGSVLQGKTYLSPTITTPIMTRDNSQNGSSANGHGTLSVLTKRELEILAHLADGKTNRDIGKMLHISTRTVDTHRSNILKKLKVKTNAELTKLAIANGLITV